jgi:hypothetical protein
MEATSARTLRAAGGWTTDPDGKVSSGVSANGQAVNSLTAFSSIAYQDRMTILAGGAQPDSVRFSFLLTGEVRNALGANARSRPSADLEMIWDSEFAPGFSQGFVEAPGSYTFTFALTPSAIGRAITFASRLSTFSIFEAIDPTQPFFGSTTTDFANTSTLLQLQFLRADGTGQGSRHHGRRALRDAQRHRLRDPAAGDPGAGDRRAHGRRPARARRRRARQASWRRKTSAALIPPKPKLLDSATSGRASRRARA